MHAAISTTTSRCSFGGIIIDGDMTCCFFSLSFLLLLAPLIRVAWWMQGRCILEHAYPYGHTTTHGSSGFHSFSPRPRQARFNRLLLEPALINPSAAAEQAPAALVTSTQQLRVVPSLIAHGRAAVCL